MTRPTPRLPRHMNGVFNRIVPVLQVDAARNLSALSRTRFLTAWRAILYLCPGLHPDSVVLDTLHIAKRRAVVDAKTAALDPRLAEYDPESGWPIALIPVVEEAWRRYEEGRLTDDEFYNYRASCAGQGIRLERNF